MFVRFIRPLLCPTKRKAIILFRWRKILVTPTQVSKKHASHKTSLVNQLDIRPIISICLTGNSRELYTVNCSIPCIPNNGSHPFHLLRRATWVRQADKENANAPYLFFIERTSVNNSSMIAWTLLWSGHINTKAVFPSFRLTSKAKEITKVNVTHKRLSPIHCSPECRSSQFLPPFERDKKGTRRE